MKKQAVISGVKKEARWWLQERLKKIREVRHHSMEVNPFMAPLVAALHGCSDFSSLADLLLAGHFVIGHSTGFGKLIDEKILPNVFGTTKLDSRFRRSNKLYGKTCFDNIDHIVTKGANTVLLSQKASKWTIQLGQAVELNKSFQTILALREEGRLDFEKIVVATFYGKESELSDKYRIVRGITTGANHDVADVSDDVEILAGKEFWGWIGDDGETQFWVMEGISEAVSAESAELSSVKSMLEDYKASFSEKYSSSTKKSAIDWQDFLAIINGK